MSSLTYAGAGVDYDAMDPFKRACQKRAALTSDNARRFGLVSLEWTRGESVHVMYEQRSSASMHRHFGHVEEGLGTKNLIADAMYALTGKSYYDQIAQDNVAMVVNDMATLGILPTTFALHVASGTSEWFEDHIRSADLVNGTGDACDLARCVWGGGETPTLKGIVVPGTVLLSGSAAGVSKSKKIIDPKNIRHGDVMVFVESTGIHANGLTMARKIADKWATPDNSHEGYLKTLSDGRTYGESLLEPTHIYAPLIEDCLDVGVDVHYAVHITGHGWRKLMRAKEAFTYVVERLPRELPIFDFLQEHGPIDDEEAYGNFNMGAGFALYVSEADALTVLAVAGKLGFIAHVAGHIEAGDKKVVIKPVGIEFAAKTLAVR